MAVVVISRIFEIKNKTAIAIIAAIVAVVYSLHENPTVLISILYIGGILAGIHVWNKKK